MYTKGSDEFISNRSWFREIVGGKNLILRSTSALEYLQLFDGYMGESEIYVYSQNEQAYENIKCRIVKNFEGIHYFKHANILCTSLSQTINDMLEDEYSDEQALCEALSNYYHSNNESFSGLDINFQNKRRFDSIAEYAKVYYCGNFCRKKQTSKNKVIRSSLKATT